MSINKIILICVSGAIIGMINGCFGGGGGMLCVPVLRYISQLDEKHSHATAIMVMLPISIASAIIYITMGNVDFVQCAWTSIGVVAGGIVGAYVLNTASNTVIELVFITIMLAAGLKMVI